MAKLQSATITNASGSIGGMTFAKNRGGLYLRARAAVTNPQTAGQTLIRTMLATASTTWRTLTPVQREGWEDWASVNPITNVFGNPILMTGHQAYIALNAPRLQAGLPQIDDAPVGFGQPVAMSVAGTPSVIVDDDDVDLTLPVSSNEPETGDVLLYISKPQSPTTKFFKGPFQLLGTGAFAGTHTTTTLAFDQTKLPPVAAGQVLWYRVRLTTDTGRLSVPLIGSILVTEAP